MTLFAAVNIWRWHPHPEVWVLVVGSDRAVRLRHPGDRADGRPDDEVIVTKAQIRWFVAAMVTLEVAADWPMHDIGEKYLYSVHMVQHLLLSFVLPPMVLLATPTWLARLVIGNGRGYRVMRWTTRVVPATIFFNVVVVFSHWPAVVALRSSTPGSTTGCTSWSSAVALNMWMGVCSPLPELRFTLLVQAGYLFLQSVVPTVPAGILVFSETVAYKSYNHAGRILGMTPIEDQQLAATIMKVGRRHLSLGDHRLPLHPVRDPGPGGRPRPGGAARPPGARRRLARAALQPPGAVQAAVRACRRADPHLGRGATAAGRCRPGTPRALGLGTCAHPLSRGAPASPRYGRPVLDVKLLRDEIDEVRGALGRRHIDLTDLDRAAALDRDHRAALAEAERLRAEVRRLSGAVAEARRGGDAEAADRLATESRAVGAAQAPADAEAARLAAELRTVLLGIPNLPAEDAPDGAGPEANVVVRVSGRSRPGPTTSTCRTGRSAPPGAGSTRSGPCGCRARCSTCSAATAPASCGPSPNWPWTATPTPGRRSVPRRWCEPRR